MLQHTRAFRSLNNALFEEAVSPPTPAHLRAQESKRIAELTKEFLNAGGSVEVIPQGKSGHRLSACTKVDSNGRVHITLNPNPIH
jgi:hypothetical protein